MPSSNVGIDFTESANLTAHLRKRDGTPRQWERSGPLSAGINDECSYSSTLQLANDILIA